MYTKNFDPSKPVVVSPGPTSDLGKSIASKNSLKHGCCADTLILKSENEQDYKTLEATWFKAYAPKDEAENHLVQELVNADWFLQRSTRTVATVEAELLDLQPNPLQWTDQQQKTFGRFLRYQTTRANTVKRCIKAIEDYRKNRVSEKQAETKTALAQERFEIYKEKNKPKPTIQEILHKMLRDKAEKDQLAQQTS